MRNMEDITERDKTINPVKHSDPAALIGTLVVIAAAIILAVVNALG